MVGLVLILLAPAIWLYDNDLLTRPRFSFGALCIFLYVGAEVSIGSLIVNYLIQADVFGIGAADAATYVGFYWGGAMVGRFIGAVVLRLISPGKVLAAVATGSIILILITANSTGQLAGWSLLLIGLMNSIMFPTIFTLGIKGLGPLTEEGSGLLIMAIAGGALVVVQGWLADSYGLQTSFLLTAACEVYVLFYALWGSKTA